jgi:hypothetical protein
MDEILYVEGKKSVWGWFAHDSCKRISKYKLDLVGVQEVKWKRGGAETADEYTFFYGKGNENHELRSAFVNKRIISTVNRVKSVLGCYT